MSKKLHDNLILGLVLQIIGLFMIDYYHIHGFAMEVILTILNTLVIIIMHWKQN